MNQVKAGFRETLRAVFSDRYAVSTLIGSISWATPQAVTAHTNSHRAWPIALPQPP